MGQLAVHQARPCRGRVFIHDDDGSHRIPKGHHPPFSYSEGGLFVFGDEFILVSGFFEQFAEKIQRVAKKGGLDVPVYFLPSLTSTYKEHIDCDYQVINQLKLIYGSGHVFHKDNKDAIRKLEQIAKRHGFDIRKYESSEEAPPEEEIDYDRKDHSEIARKFNGINSIVLKDKLLTSSIHPKEAKYLKKRGLDAIIVPLGDVCPGAGLRCVYGEFNI
jgi:hypothetical protein